MLKNYLALSRDHISGACYLTVAGGTITCASLEEAKSILLRGLEIAPPTEKGVE
jgi:hypothetical protein